MIVKKVFQKKKFRSKKFFFSKVCRRGAPERNGSRRLEWSGGAPRRQTLEKKLFWTELFSSGKLFWQSFNFGKTKLLWAKLFLAHFDVGQEKDWVRISFNQSFPLFTGKQKYLNLAYYMFWNKLKYTIQYIQIIAVSVFLFVDIAMTDEHSQLFFFLFTLFASSSCFFHFDELNSWWYKFQQSLKVKTLIH